MERKYDLSFRGLMNAIHGRPYYGEERTADPLLVFQRLRQLVGKGVSCKLTNYAWIPEEKNTITLAPETVARLLEKKIEENPGINAIEFEIDHFLYYGKNGEMHIFEIYKAFRDSMQNKNIRLPGKIMKLEFLTSPLLDSG